MTGRSPSDGEPQFRSWPLLVLAFGFLLFVMAGSYAVTWKGAAQLHTTVARVNEAYHTHARSIEQVRSRIQATRLLVRDYLLEPTPENSAALTKSLRQQKAETAEAIRNLQPLGNGSAAAHLEAGIAEYFATLEPLLEWSPDQNLDQRYAALRTHVQPQREAVVKIVERVQAQNEESLERDVQHIAATEEQFTETLQRMMMASVFVGILVAIASVLRVHVLERRNEIQHQRTQQAEQEMRRLSQQVVRAHEDERRSLSRELHDEVGQMLTGLRMELKAISRLYGAPIHEFQARIEQGRRVVEQMLQAVRDMAMGLRPSMLDDLGLEAALQWQAREFARRHDIGVDLHIGCDLSSLPDQHRTNLYRVVQEALTNCARHSGAKSVSVSIEATPSRLRLSIHDDGVGFTPRAASGGLGLIGMQERVRDLGGTMEINSGTGRGTTLIVMVPVSWKEAHIERTSIACG